MTAWAWVLVALALSGAGGGVVVLALTVKRADRSGPPAKETRTDQDGS